MTKLTLFLIFLTCYILPESGAEIGIRLGYCTFSCFKKPEEKFVRKGYYWRDYIDGKIPKDAVPGGNIDGKTTYIGSVYDPANGGEYAVDIIPGETSVLSAQDKVSKLDKNILILCTEQPEKLRWEYITRANVSSLKGGLISGGTQNFKDTKARSFIQKVLSLGKSNVGDNTYIGEVLDFKTGIHLNIPPGKSQFLTSGYALLTFDKSEDKTEMPKSPFLVHNFNAYCTATGILPVVTSELKVGSCGYCCSNEKNNQNGDQEENSESDLDYYWRNGRGSQLVNYDYFYADENTKKHAIAKSLEVPLDKMLAVGDSDNPNSVVVYNDKDGKIYSRRSNFKVLSSDNNVTLEWVTVSPSNVSQYKDIMIKGGSTKDFEDLYIGIGLNDKNEMFPGRVYLGSNPRIVYQPNGKSQPWFKVLTYKKPQAKPKPKNSFLSSINKMFGFSLIMS